MRSNDEKTHKVRSGRRPDQDRQRQPAGRSSSNGGAAAKAEKTGQRSIGQSLQEYGRGVAGGMLFSLPLLYTMEVWWAGFSLQPWRLLAGLLVTMVLLLGYNRYAGLRRDANFTEVAIDSIEELGIGLLIATIMLWLMGRITPDMPASEIVGKIVIEALVVAIGVSVGTAQLGGEEEDTGESDSNGEAGNKDDFAGQLVLAFCGAVLIAGNVAPTEEIIMLAIELSAWQLLGLALVSLTLNALILFHSGFRGAPQRGPTDGFFATIVGSVITYAVALLAAAMLLWFFGSFDGYAPGTWLAETVVLGVAAALGASAGRLLLQPSDSSGSSD